MNRIDSNHITARLDAEVGMTRERAGSLAGEQVHVKDAISVLEDAREEISMHHSEKVEAKEFAEREIEGGHAPMRLSVEQIESYLDASKRFRDPRELADLLKQMQSSARPRDVSQKATRSPAQQFALLQLALDDARKRGLPVDVIERLTDALEELQHEAGPQILAGLNTAEAASEFAPTAEGVEHFQQAYTDIVLGENTLAQTLLVVLGRLAGKDGQDFQKGLQALLRALGADLSATRSSTDPKRLQSLVQDVYQLEVTGSILENCTQMSASIAKRFGIQTVVPLELLKDLVGLTNERWVTPQRFRALGEKFGITGLMERIAFHSGTKAALRRMPVQVFQDAEARQGVIGSAQAAIDEAVAEEEERQGP